MRRVKAREEVEVDEEDPGLQGKVGALGEHVAMSDEVMVVKEAEVESVKGGQQGKVEDVVDLCQKVILNTELLIMKSNYKWVVINL